MRRGWLIAAAVISIRVLRRRAMTSAPPPALPPGMCSLIAQCRAGDASACALVARRREARSVTELAQIVWPLGPVPRGAQADALLDGWALAAEIRRDKTHA